MIKENSLRAFGQETEKVITIYLIFILSNTAEIHQRISSYKFKKSMHSNGLIRLFDIKINPSQILKYKAMVDTS